MQRRGIFLTPNSRKEPKFQLIGSQIQQCKKSTEFNSKDWKKVFMTLNYLPKTWLKLPLFGKSKVPMFMCLVPKFLQIPFQFLEIYSLILKLLSNLWKLMLTSIFRLILLFEFLTLECIAYECMTASKCLKRFGFLNQPTKQEPKFQLIGSQLQQCKKSTELSSNILKNGIIFVSVYYFLEQFSFDFIWKMNEKLDSLIPQCPH